MQILNAIAGTQKGWANHPCVRMWRDYVPLLEMYHDAMIWEWIRRGYNNSMQYRSSGYTGPLPQWIGDPVFHASHRSNLLRKDPVWYGQFGWTEGPDMEYVWP